MSRVVRITLLVVGLLVAAALRGCAVERDDRPGDAPAPVTAAGEPAPREFRPRVLYDSGWRRTASRKTYRLRLYAGQGSARQALVVYGHLGGTDGARPPFPDMDAAQQERCDFEDSDGLVDLKSGFAWVRFARLPTSDPVPASTAAPAPRRMFSTQSLFVDPVGTEFIVVTSARARLDAVYVTSPGAVEVTQRYVPGAPRARVEEGKLIRRGRWVEPTLSEEPLTADPLRQRLATDVLGIVRSAINGYNKLADNKRPTKALNPPAYVESVPPEQDSPIDDLLDR